MGIFGRRNGEKKSNSSDQNQQGSGWDNMLPPSQTPERNPQLEKAARQQRKILACYALGEEGFADVIKEHDVAMSDEYREGILDMIASGQVTEELKDSLLDGIASAVDQDGTEKVFDSINSKHERRILSIMARHSFDGWANTNASDIEAFVNSFPSPKDFEDQSIRLLDMIEEGNGAAKRAEYASSMEEFKRKIYGKKYEYYEQMKALDAEALERYWKPGDVGYCQTSRSQAKDGYVSRDNIEKGLWADEACEDQIFVDPDKQLYAVFDGAGGMNNGRLAAQIANGVLGEYNSKYDMKHCSSLAIALEEANNRIYNTPNMNGGCSTGAIASVIDMNGRSMLAYASVGDSRIYIVDKSGVARMITQDEGWGNVIMNALGSPVKPGESRCQQFGQVDLHEGDRVVICSDGVTGDYDNDRLSDIELGKIVKNSRGAADASKNLIAAAKKNDDRSAIVIVPDLKRA